MLQKGQKIQQNKKTERRRIKNLQKKGCQKNTKKTLKTPKQDVKNDDKNKTTEKGNETPQKRIIKTKSSRKGVKK